MATMNVSLPDRMKAWVEARVKSGQYANASDYVRDLIRRDQNEGEKLERLRAAIDSGRNSGVSPRTVDQIMRDTKADLRNGQV